MSGGASQVTERAVEMRREFDRAFSDPVRLDETLKENYLAIRTGGQACAIRLSEISGLFADRKITPVPGGHTALRGIAGFRGNILPVYDLPAALGFPSAPSLRWLVIAKMAPVALAFETFDGQLRVPASAVLPQAARPEMSGYARDFLRAENFSGPIIHLPSVLSSINVLKIEAV